MKGRHAGRMILPAPLRYFAVARVTAASAKYRGGVGEIISPTFFLILPKGTDRCPT